LDGRVQETNQKTKEKGKGKNMDKKYEKRKLVCMAVLVSSMFVLNPLGAQAANPRSDENITFWVMDALRQDPRVLTQDIQVRTENGMVTLSGTAWNLAGKYYAERETAKIIGVRGVIDEMNVAPSFRSDAEVGQDVLKRLAGSSTIASQGLGVSVQDGVVTLTGEVASWAEMRQAGLVAREVRGVRRVDNNLKVEAISEKRPDDRIRKDVAATLTRDVYLTGLPIDVTVKKGVVVLKGTVGSVYEKKRAYEDACIDGVVEVKDALTVDPWSDDNVRVASPKITNDQLKQAVRDELYQDLRLLDPYAVHVAASSGQVTLYGRIPTYHQKQVAERDAHDVVGVHWVKNLLTVHADERSDEAIRNDVRWALNTDYALSGLDIPLRVTNGVVVLSGDASSIYERDHAAQVAGDVLGVRDVINHISVQELPKYSNAALAQQIRDRLAADAETFRTAERITVKVENGKAVLTGEVANWAQYKEAGELALRTHGIRSLDNRLGVADVAYPLKD
jgi:osmotically-inducible protein OsmY